MTLAAFVAGTWALTQMEITLVTVVNGTLMSSTYLTLVVIPVV